MFDKILGVSPTQKGLAQDSKVEDKKSFQPDFKKDFERQLQKKLDDKSSNASKENGKDPKAIKEPKKDEAELRADHKQKKPSGEIKKKMVESDEELMISNVMALPKSEFEIPDKEIDLATIKTDGNSEKIQATDLAAQAKSQLALDLEAVKLESKANEDTANLEANAVKTQLAPGVLNAFAKLEKSQAPIERDEFAEPKANVEAEILPMQKAQLEKTLSFQEQLSEEVGFESDLKQHVAQAGLVQKMKEFESEKGLAGAKAQDFEQSVLEKLQQGTSKLAEISSDSKKSDSENSSKNDESLPDSLKELKADNLKSSSDLHTGQTDPAFKAHLNSPLEKAGSPTALSQLMDKRDENVQEVLKQAHFLATKGGGEMTVKMSPDGMGEIQLKVLMQDGKLSIDMQTQDKSVKKLIEDSLSELKSGLAAQQLQVDHVKITSVNATNTENSTQFQSQQDQSGAQQQQKDFWKSFQENFSNQSRRSSYGDVGAVKSRTPSEPEALQPIKTGSRSYGRTGSTINKVA